LDFPSPKKVIAEIGSTPIFNLLIALSYIQGFFIGHYRNMSVIKTKAEKEKIRVQKEIQVREFASIKFSIAGIIQPSKKLKELNNLRDLITKTIEENEKILSIPPDRFVDDALYNHQKQHNECCLKDFREVLASVNLRISLKTND
jgi:hypothetical protein